MKLSSVEVKAGQRVSGRYKRGGRDASDLSIAVAAPIVYRGAGMLVGTNLATGAIIGVYVDAFDPRSVKVEDGVEGDAFDVEGLYLTSGTRAFAFIESVKPEDREWAEALDGKPIESLAVDNVRIVVAV